jgi:hypothetical protein
VLESRPRGGFLVSLQRLCGGCREPGAIYYKYESINATKKPRKPPTQYRCTHCGISGLKKKDGTVTGYSSWLQCKRCKFGALAKMHWNGFRWC